MKAIIKKTRGNQTIFAILARPNEIAFAVLLFELINLTFYFFYFSRNHYLSPPFLMDANDTFMDFYNPLYWALNDGFYNVYKSIYPALSYFILKLFGIGIANVNIYENPFAFRDAHPELALFLLVAYMAVILSVINLGEWRKINYINKFILFLACIFSVPILFAYERGNIIFFALLFLALYLNASKEWFRAFYMGLLLNLKPYFIVFLVQYINKGGYTKNELLKIVFLSTLIFFGLGWLANIDFTSFFQNYLLFSKKGGISHYGIIALPHSLSALGSINHYLHFEGSSYRFWFSALKVVNYIPLLVLLFYSITKKLSKIELLIISFFVLCSFTNGTGGYILIAYLVLIPYLINSVEYRVLLIPILGIYALPLDWISIVSIPADAIKSYLSGVTVTKGFFYIGLGSIIRPMLNFSAVVIFTNSLVRKYSLNYMSKDKQKKSIFYNSPGSDRGG